MNSAAYDIVTYALNYVLPVVPLSAPQRRKLPSAISRHHKSRENNIKENLTHPVAKKKKAVNHA